MRRFGMSSTRCNLRSKTKFAVSLKRFEAVTWRAGRHQHTRARRRGKHYTKFPKGAPAACISRVAAAIFGRAACCAPSPVRQA